MASLRERARKQRPSLRTGERLDSVAESVVNHSVSPAAPADSILPADTLTDSEILALDSMPPAPRKSRIVREKVDIDNAVDFAAKDSLVMMGQNAAFMYGASNVKYADIDLSADEIHMDMKESLVYAVGRKDTTDEVVGSPVFKDRSGEYQSKTMTYNFKTSKGFITDVVTQQGEGYLTGGQTKKLADDSYNIINGRYTTCDDHEHPHFYMQLTKAKMRPKKDIVTGPAYMVLCDVPLPLAVPFGYFPFTSKYSSGVIFPTFGDDYNKGFYLRDGGYYFALSDYADLALTGEIYTKGSWGISAASNYRKRYKHSGSFYFSYQDTRTGDKGMPDYTKQTSFKVQWNHRQDSKANPFSSLSASVNFATSSYERNNMNSLYNPQTLTQSTRTSSVSWSTTFSSIGLSLSSTANLNQNMRDSTIAMTLPDLNISLSRFYPFKRKHAAGNERWYEKISLSYTGQLSNSISTKEDKFMHSNLVKDWRNGFQHNIPLSGSFTLFNYLNVNPTFSFTDRMYTNKIDRSWDTATQKEVCDTTYGFHNVYNWSASISMSTKMYGFWIPSRKLFGDKIQAIRHVITPTVSFSYAPDFGASRYGYWKTYQKTDADGNVSLVEYSPFSQGLYGVPGRGRTGNISFGLSNNLEMKVKSDKDSTGMKKISLIDELGLRMSYNMADKERPWSDLSMDIRLKWWKNYTFNMAAVFATYAYELDKDGRPYVGTHTEWGKGRFGRFQGTSQNISFTLTPEKLKKLFGHGDDEDDKDKRKKNRKDDEGVDTDIESNVDDDMIEGQRGAKKSGGGKAETDEDGYMKFKMPWSLTFGYGITMRENTQGKFNTKTMRYPYKFTQTLNMSGNVRISDGWNISFSSGYDFEFHKMSMTTASLQRDLHCFNMSCQVVLAPYTSYNFTFRCNAATLTDALKYDKRSGYSNAVQWY